MFESKDGKIKSWIDWASIDPSTENQIRGVSEHPELLGHLAIMPDTHFGVGVSIGTVFPTNPNVIVPNAVGVDIGCGVAYGRTPYTMTDLMGRYFWKRWEAHVRDEIPVGFTHHADEQSIPTSLKNRSLPTKELENRASDRAWYQLGTLGGGNHFMEALVDAVDGHIWLAVHSGSRNIGHTIASYYEKVAIKATQKLGVRVPTDLAYLDTDSDEGRGYVRSMIWAVEYAKINRRVMMDRMGEAFILALKESGISIISKPTIINDRSHNYAQLEFTTQYGTAMIHRKGAMSPKAHGFIPGSMGTTSYVVQSKEVDDAYGSSSHGAGRTMGRRAAKRSLSLEDFQNALAGTFSTASSATLDEAPGAYKDIDEVMQNQIELVTILHKLKPVITIKGATDAAE